MTLYKRRLRGRDEDALYRTWTGPYRPYDLVKEAAVAFVVVLALSIALAFLFSSPDERPSTIRSWARSMPIDFVTTATSELAGTSVTAEYGPPYNHASTGQHELFIHLQEWLGVTHPINAARDFVLAPLASIPDQPKLTAALRLYEHASAAQRSAWTAAYERALADAAIVGGGRVATPSGSYGPLPTMMASLLTLAQDGGLDGALLTSRQFYQTDYTKPLMFLADGAALADRAQAEHLLGGQWGMMNETGSYPGQVWLWLYTFFYQIRPFSTSPNADILVMTIMVALSTLFVLTPYLPVVNRIPRLIPIYKLIWREHYRSRS